MGAKSATLDREVFERLLDDLSLSPADLSRLSGVSQATISRIRTRGHKPRPAIMRKLAFALATTELPPIDLSGRRSNGELAS